MRHVASFPQTLRQRTLAHISTQLTVDRRAAQLSRTSAGTILLLTIPNQLWSTQVRSQKAVPSRDCRLKTPTQVPQRPASPPSARSCPLATSDNSRPATATQLCQQNVIEIYHKCSSLRDSTKRLGLFSQLYGTCWLSAR